MQISSVLSLGRLRTAFNTNDGNFGVAKARRNRGIKCESSAGTGSFDTSVTCC